jgi:hypothetical protein
MSKLNNRTRQDFLMTFFTGESFEEKEVNRFWLVKHWNGNSKMWEVAIFSKESYQRMKIGQQKYKEQNLDWIQ